MKRIAILICTTGLMCLPLWAWANTDDDLTLLMELLSPIATLSGDFRQQTLDARQQSLQVITGEFVLHRAGPKLLWQTTTPDEQILRVRDDTLWTLDLSLEQLLIQDLGSMLEQSPALLLTGSASDIGQRYAVERLEQTDSDVLFALIPRDSSSAIERIEIRFDRRLPERIRLVDSFQQTTILVFIGLALNEPANDSDFDFDIPDHFDVIDQRTP